MKSAGIYRIVSPSGNCYVGSSKCISRRFGTHKSDLRGGKHHARALQAAVNKYGIEAMRFEPIFSVFDLSDLLTFEQQFIDEFKPQYNSTHFASAPSQDPAVAARMSATAKKSPRHMVARAINQIKASIAVSRAVIRLTDGVVFPSAYEATRAHGRTHMDTLGTALRNGWLFSGHYWKFADSDVTLADLEAKAALSEITRKANAAAAMTKTTRRPVCRESDGAVFTSISEAARQEGVHLSAIHRAAQTGMRANGTRWSYVER